MSDTSSIQPRNRLDSLPSRPTQPEMGSEPTSMFRCRSVIGEYTDRKPGAERRLSPQGTTPGLSTCDKCFKNLCNGYAVPHASPRGSRQAGAGGAGQRGVTRTGT